MPTCYRLGYALLSVAAVAVSAAAQAPPAPLRQLSLAEALDLAKRHSPVYLQDLATADPAAEAVRNAQWARLPTITANTNAQYTGVGSSTFGGQTFTQGATIFSSYQVQAVWQLNTRAFLAPALNRAQERAVEEHIAATGVTLVSDVTSQYLNVLRAAATLEVARQQVASDSLLLVLARTRFRIGQASQIDVLTAQTTQATAEAAQIQAEVAETQAKTELVRRLGLTADVNIDSLTLRDDFALVAPQFDLGALRKLARESSPAVRQLIAQDRANQLGVRAARLDHLPTFTVSTGIGGYTQQFTDENALLNQQLRNGLSQRANCITQNEIIARLTSPLPDPGGGITVDCNSASGLNSAGTGLEPSLAQAIHESNSVFPFNFTRNPISVSFSVSVPIWDAFTRSLRTSQAEALKDQSAEGIRAQQILTDMTIQNQVVAVNAAWRRIQLQDTNRVAARQQLQLARDRYRLSNGTVLEVTTAQDAQTLAEANYVNAVYDYHLAIVALEAAVGRPLR
jgi:outer membrane protein TolC